MMSADASWGPSRRSQVPTFQVMTILDQVAQLRASGHEVISLCVGEPVTGAPAAVRRRAAEAMSDGSDLGYSSAFGLLPLREALAGHYRRWYGIDVEPRNIAITTGSSGAFLLGFLAAFDAGDRVALARPGYAAYKNILSGLGCEVVELDCGPEERFQPSVEQLAAAHAEAPLQGLVVASPANPTGTMVTAEHLAELAEWCSAHGVRIISDEIYHGVTYTGSVGESLWQHDRHHPVVSSFSKFWGMTGWRLGWMLVPDDLVDAVDALAGNFALCAPVPAQYAAIEAFREESYQAGEDAVADYAAAREVVLQRLPELGWIDVAPADGAFYLYATITPVLGPFSDSIEWCAALLEQKLVAVTPGEDFDSAHGDQAIRLSMASGKEAVAEAITRILDFQKELGVGTDEN